MPVIKEAQQNKCRATHLDLSRIFQNHILKHNRTLMPPFLKEVQESIKRAVNPPLLSRGHELKKLVNSERSQLC